MLKFPGVTLSFTSLISAYARLQSSLISQVRNLSTSISSANPGSFILLQFQMGQLTQTGESISNLIAKVNELCSYTVSMMKQ